MEYTNIDDVSATLFNETEMNGNFGYPNTYPTHLDFNDLRNIYTSSSDLTALGSGSTDPSTTVPSTSDSSNEMSVSPLDAEVPSQEDLDEFIASIQPGLQNDTMIAAPFDPMDPITPSFFDEIGSMPTDGAMQRFGELAQSSESLRLDLQANTAGAASAPVDQTITDGGPQRDVQVRMTLRERCQSRPAVSTDSGPGNRRGMIKPCPCGVPYTKALNDHKNRCTPFQDCRAECWFYQHFRSIWIEKKGTLVDKRDPDTGMKASANGLWTHMYEDKKPRSTKKKQQRQAGASSQ